MMQIIFTFFVALLGAWIAKKLKMPAPGMTGSMILVGIVSVFTSQMYFPNFVKVLAQIITGAYIGQQISKHDVHSLRYLYRPILLLLIMLSLNTFVMGFIISTLCQIDITTALLSCVSGGVMDMSLISMDMGAQTQVVAFMQLIRLCGILLLLPYWIKFLYRNISEENIVDKQKGYVEIKHPLNGFLTKYIQKDVHKFCFTFILCLSFGLIGFQLGIPAGALTFSLLLSLLLKINTSVTYVPYNVRFFAQLLAGSLVGCSFTYQSITLLQTLWLPAVLLLISYFFLNYGYARITQHYQLLDFKSAIFASSPAGASDISLIAQDFGADMPKVAIIQIIRLIYSIAIMPLFIRLFII